VLTQLEALLAPETAGDPLTGLKGCRRSTRKLSAQLGTAGVAACPTTVATWLHELHYALRVNRKSIAGTQHPARDQQFHYLRAVKDDFLQRGQAVISVDSKKRELVGRFRNPGRAWRRQPAEVYMHDFPSDAQGVALPYGIYDVGRNQGTVVVGTSHDTAAFAVDAIAIWLTSYGWWDHPDMSELLILCDSGGSNGCRTRLWKYALSECLAREHGVSVTVCHYPSGASKWNPAEHRLFSFISLNWAGVPLVDYDTVLNYLRTTHTSTGLTVDATLDTTDYPTGLRLSRTQMKEITVRYHDTLPQWNYTIGP